MPARRTPSCRSHAQELNLIFAIFCTAIRLRRSGGISNRSASRWLPSRSGFNGAEMFGALADDIDARGILIPISQPAPQNPLVVSRAFVTMRLYPTSQMMTCAARTTVAAMASD